MSTPVLWPFQLQNLWNEANFGMNEGVTTMMSDMDVGPPKSRRRTTVGVDSFTGSLNINAAQYAVFRNFYDISLGGGSRNFYYRHPITEVQSVFRFVPPYKITSLGAGNFLLSFSWIEIKQ